MTTWTTVSDDSATWVAGSDSSATWVADSDQTTSWESYLTMLYVLPDYVLEGYVDDYEALTGVPELADNSWSTVADESTTWL